MVTATDFFCGMGGSSTGLVAAGYAVKLAANHWDTAIATHEANHPGTEHLCADLQAVDLRYLPRTELLWGSPICTELSPAGGRRRKGSQLDLFEEHGHVPSEAFERTRATFWEIIRAAEIHRYQAVLIENVVEAAEWELFDVWLAGMSTLGYRAQFVSVSAAHVGDESNLHAPQWRDRLYMVFTRVGMRQPDLEPRPWAWCESCGGDVQALQWWKPRKGQKTFSGRTIGKYGAQYVYVCPVGIHGVVEPYVRPALHAIDWADLGVRIGDRPSLGMKPLSPATVRRIEHGLRAIGDPTLIAASGNTWDSATGATNSYVRAWPVGESPTPAQVNTIQNGLALSEKFVMAVNHDSGRQFDPDTRPLPAQTTSKGEALVSSGAFVAMLRNHGTTTPVTDPAATFSAGGFHHGLTVPPGAFISKHHGGLDYKAIGHMNKPVTEPAPNIVTRVNNSLVIPYRKGSKAHRPDRPLSTMSTREAHGVLETAAEVEDCFFRMLTPREAANAQRFPASYQIHGNKGEQQMQAGNAVAVNVAQWLGRQVMAVL